jgi:hypothetical protein
VKNFIAGRFRLCAFDTSRVAGKKNNVKYDFLGYRQPVHRQPVHRQPVHQTK